MNGSHSFKIFLIAFFITSLIFIAGLVVFLILPADINAEAPVQWTVMPGESLDGLALRLKDEGFVRSSFAVRLALSLEGVEEIEPGAYFLSGGMHVFDIAKVVADEPFMRWILVPEGLRKEEIAEIVANIMGWDDRDISRFIQGYELVENALRDGMYYPDTYLVPGGEGGAEVAARMISRFNEKFAPYADDFLRENIRWDTALILASIVQREAAGKGDMPLVAGILWNRLVEGQRLEVDATLQYARGDAGNGWWAPIDSGDKSLDSPYNTYRRLGLPPTPISNPGLDAIEAVLHPEETDCFFYIHAEGEIYCSPTYEGHLENIDNYLR